MGDVKTSDLESFENQLAAVVKIAYGIALRLTGDRAKAEDLVQEASLLAFRAFGSFTPGTNFKAWFLKILTNCHLGHCRRRRVETVELDDDPQLYLYTRTAEIGLHGLTEDPARLVMSKMTSEHVATAIAALAPEYRAVAVLFFMEDLSYPEIAGVLDCPVGTVRSRLHRARHQLQKSLWRVAVESGILGELSAREAMT